MGFAPQIQINSALLEREALFVRIHDLEQGISALLGEPYPFTRPMLPSDAKPTRKGRAKSNPPPPDSPLRPLADDESLYRVTFREGERSLVEEHTSLPALQALWTSQNPHLQITRIETLDQAGQSLTNLYTAPPADGGGGNGG